MRYRRVGPHGIKVSELTLGTWLTFSGGVADDVARACIHKAFELGINSFDTANLYGHGMAERVLAKCLTGLRRDSVVLTTKVYFPMGDGPNDRGLSRKHIFEQCHASLKRLKTDYVDFYLCHRPDRDVPIEETLRALDDLVVQGKVLYYGVSQWPRPLLKDSAQHVSHLHAHPLAVNQVKYNLLQPESEKQVFETCEQSGIGITTYSPLAQGVLTGKYLKSIPPVSRAASPRMNSFFGDLLSPYNVHKVSKLMNIANLAGMSLTRLALQWVLRNAAVSSAIIGATSADQVQENVRALEQGCPPEVLRLATEVCYEGSTDVIA